jgi:ubiquinone/menaquinone biosynthesis C-methylase UbiE
MMKHLAPIVLFVYIRPAHTRQTLESLMQCDLADQSDLYIYSDGPKHDASEDAIKNLNTVRAILHEKQWCKNVHIIEYETNKGLPNILPSTVTRLTEKFGKIIVLEDDLILSKGFLTFMNEGLDLYEHEERVMHISGFVYPSSVELPETFFLRLSSGWGWGTWHRAWKFFNPSPTVLLKELVSEEASLEFDYDGHYAYKQMLQNCAEGPWKYWDIRWYASVFIKQGLCLHPGKSLVRNIGHDNSGEHCGESRLLSEQPIASSIKVSPIPLEYSENGKKAFIEYFESQAPSINFWRKALKKTAKTVLPQPIYDKVLVWKRRNQVQLPRRNYGLNWLDAKEYLDTWGKNSVWNEIQMLLSTHQGKVLDIGCGTGTCMKLMARLKTLEVYGCDISQTLIQQCILNGIDTTRLNVCNAKNMGGLPSGFFDYTYSISLFQFMEEEDLMQMIKEIHRITGKVSFHFIPTSVSRKNEGWIIRQFNYMNNTAEWWTVKLEESFSKIHVIDSAWRDGDVSLGKWMICIKS